VVGTEGGFSWSIQFTLLVHPVVKFFEHWDFGKSGLTGAALNAAKNTKRINVVTYKTLTDQVVMRQNQTLGNPAHIKWRFIVHLNIRRSVL
jgi:hypothetical protein